MKNIIFIAIVITFFSSPVCYSQTPNPTPFLENLQKTSVDDDSILLNKVKKDVYIPEQRTSSSIVEFMNSDKILSLYMTAKYVKEENVPVFQVVLFVRKKHTGMTVEYLKQQIELNRQVVRLKVDTIMEELDLSLDSSDIIKTSFDYVSTLLLDQHYKITLSNEQILDLRRGSSIFFSSENGKFSSKF